MSDEQPGAEQPGQSAQPPPPPAGDRWGDPISPERADRLRELADQQRAWAAQEKPDLDESSFKDISLTGADVFWLAAYAWAGPDGDLAAAQELLRTLTGKRYLRSKYSLPKLLLQKATLSKARLEGADLHGAHLEGANLTEAHLEGKPVPADDLARIHLSIPDFPATLPPADLREVFLDTATNLKDAIVGNQEYGYISLADVRWGGVNLTVVQWELRAHPAPIVADRARRGGGVKRIVAQWAQVIRTWLPRGHETIEIGDERTARQPTMKSGEQKGMDQRLAEYAAAVRANRQLETALRDQGWNEQADRLTYRAQVLQRRVLWMERQHAAHLFSLFLYLVTGYGQRLRHILFAYVAVVLFFTAIYFILGSVGGHHVRLDATLIESLKAIREPDPSALLSVRGFLTFLEGILGLVLEATLVGMLVQRLRAGNGGGG